MSEFIDRILVQLSAPNNLIELVSPASDANQVRIKALINAAYDLSFATLHSVQSTQLISAEYQRPLFPPRRKTGTWTQTQPTYARTDVQYNEEDILLPAWLDISARLGLTLVLEVDAANVESILTRQISQFNTLAEFKSHFQFIDLDAFMAKHNLVTVQDLQDAFQYLVTEIHMQTPPVFNPADAANQFHYDLNIAVLIRDTFDLAAALRAAKHTRSILERALTYRGEVPTAEVRSPYAILVLFPSGSTPAAGPTEAQVQAFFAAEQILAVFITPA